MSESNGKVLTKTELLNCVWNWPKPVRVTVPDLGTVYVRMLTAAECDLFQAGGVTYKDGKAEPNLTNMRGRLVALCACDDKGTRLFEDDDAEQIGEQPYAVIEPIFMAAQRINGLGGEAREEVKKN